MVDPKVAKEFNVLPPTDISVPELATTFVCATQQPMNTHCLFFPLLDVTPGLAIIVFPVAFMARAGCFVLVDFQHSNLLPQFAQQANVGCRSKVLHLLTLAPIPAQQAQILAIFFERVYYPVQQPILRLLRVAINTKPHFSHHYVVVHGLYHFIEQ